MDRAAKLRRSPLAIAAAALAAALVAVSAPPWALADAPAADEYSIEVPGVDVPGVEQNPAASAPADLDSPRDSAKPLPQGGVVGEASPPQSPLDALGSSLADAPLVALAVLFAVALLPLAPRRRAQRA